MRLRVCEAILSRVIAVSLGLVAPMAVSAAGPTAQELLQVILGTSTVGDETLRRMDTNSDGKVDAADLFALGQTPPAKSLYGHIWQVTASYGNYATGVLPLRYSFLIKVNAAPGLITVGSMLTTDPSKAATRQGARQSYPMSAVLPEGTQFSLAESGVSVTLSSPEIIIPANTDFNPIADRDLKHSWQLTIDTSTLTSEAPGHGAIKETIMGLLPFGRPVELTGTIELADLGLL